jgi:DNA-binding FadR family transcriptional regulator
MESQGSAVRVPKTAELVAQLLRQRIVRGELHEGDTLPPEAALMTEFSVSRPTLREAFRVLESEGLINVHRGSRGGARVQLPSVDVVSRYVGLVLEHRGASVADLSTARAILEVACAQSVAARRDVGQLVALRQAVGEAATIGDPLEQLEAQQRFHQLLVDQAGNETIALLHGAVQQLIDRATMARAATGSPRASAAQHLGARAHERFLQSVAAGDVEASGRIWRRHIDETYAYLASHENGRRTR